jgi:flavin-dependent dehydrogenase
LKTVQSTAQGEKIAIIGAGPAGLVCSIVLARAGWRVLVREWRKTVDTRFHGDFQGLENWTDDTDILEEMRSYGIAINFDVHPVYNGIAFDAWGASYEVGSDKPLYYLVHRGPDARSFGHGLLDCARRAGVEVSFGDRVKEIDGPAILAIGPRAADAIATGYVFETDMADGNWLCLDDKLAPNGYSYLLVHEGRGTVASCMFKGFKRQADYVERTVSMFRERAGLKMQNPRPFGGFANFRLPRTGVQGGHPVIGEHAGFQDALAGFGMRYAIRSGVLAARSLIEGIDYTRLWRRELLPRLRTSISNRLVFSVLGNRGRSWVLAHRLSGRDTRIQLQNLYRPSCLTRILFPIARWHHHATISDKSCDHVDCSCVWCRCGDAIRTFQLN